MSACKQCLSASLARAGLIEELESGAGVSGGLRERLDAGISQREYAATTSDLDWLVAETERHELWTICRHDPEFPARLTCFARRSDVPHVLFGRGDKRHLDQLATSSAVSLVGARRASAYGREAAYSLARECAAAGIVVVSGMALGIDGAAHRGALAGSGATIAVLAGGPEVPYPRSHRLLYEQILAAGCVVSEAPPGATARRWSFVARNRIIAGLSDLTVFVEGTVTSGARHTIDFADELEIPIGAVPGPITSPLSVGPNALLGEAGVVAVRGTDDICSVVGLEPSPPAQGEASGTAERVLTQISCGDRDPRALAAALGDISSRELLRLLGELELAGRVRRGPGGQYERCGPGA